MCNPVALVAGAVGAVAGKKSAEKKASSSSSSSSTLNESKDMEKNIISNPLIPDTFQARVRIGKPRGRLGSELDQLSNQLDTYMNPTTNPFLKNKL